MIKFIRGTFVLITVVMLLVYFVASLSPYISPLVFWPITFLSLGFLFIAISTFLVILIWLFVNWKASAFLFALFILVGYSNLKATVALHFFSNFNYQKDSNALRVMTWNVRYFDENIRLFDTPNSIRRQMFDFIRKADPDVILFQDYLDYQSNTMTSNISMVRDSLGYSYCYTTKDMSGHNSYGDSDAGVGMFSKIPLTDSGKATFNIGSESVGYIDLLYKNRKVRILTTHLLSTGIHPSKEYSAGYRDYDSIYAYGRSVMGRLQYYDQVHTEQAKIVKAVADESPHPVIITGDFNSVPSSYVYHLIKGNRKDVFVNKGLGLGHTYKGLSKTLRIDFMLVDQRFRVKQVATPQLNLSDHYPVIADLYWK